MNIDELIATAQPRTEVVRICARGDLVARHAEAAAALRKAMDDDQSPMGDPATVEASKAVVAIEAERDAATVEFTLQAVSRQKWANLLAKHPPTAEQRRAGHDNNPETFPVAAVAECCKEPTLTVEKAQQLAEVLHMGEWNKLWITVVGLNTTGTPDPKLAAATELLRVNGHSSTTQPLEGSLADGF